MLLWTMKVHKGELRMFGGVWRRVGEFSPPLPDWAQQAPGQMQEKQRASAPTLAHMAPT